MELIRCTRREIKQYIRFTKRCYEGNPYYRDSMSPVLKSILYNKSIFCKDKEIIPVLIIEGSKIKAVSTYIYTIHMKDTLQIAFFEAEEHCQEAVDLIMEEAKRICREKGSYKITMGLNGHINYGLGLLASHFNQFTSFGIAYNPSFYIDYFRKYNPREYTLKSYICNMNTFDLDEEKKMIEYVNKRFTFRKANFRNFDEEVEIYNDLNSVCFKDHLFYYETTKEEDYELLWGLQLFIKEENLLVAEKNGTPIGFLLWYPDFNELIPQGKSLGVGTWIKNKLKGNQIQKFKIVEIGVHPKYQGKGVILGLFNKCMELTKGRYTLCESNWILDNNLRSKGFGLRWADEEYKQYKVFELTL